MDFSESTNVVYNRIQKIEPENVSKIIGFLLLQDHGEREMIRLAFSPDNLIHSLINKAKTELGLSKPPVLAPISPSRVNQVPCSELHLPFTSYLPILSPSVSSPRTLRGAKTYWDPQVAAVQQPVHNAGYVPPIFLDSVAQDYHLQNHMQFLTLDDQLESANSVASEYSSNSYDPEPTFGVRVGRRSPSLPEVSVKVCHYFSKGFCKHGNNCRYFHGNPMAESFSLILSPSLNELPNEDHVFSPGCLEKLEMELTELLKSRRGFPVSIASLPMIYYEKFGRTLQAEGYLTESQRHGKAGYSLTKLLARLKNSIRLIDRPRGQHSVILAENVPTYLENAGEGSDSGRIVAGSRQIYLTFPAESTFTEQDVSNYFNKFGLVRDVRIPCQQKRMFGFITFVYSETVKQILAKGNPHFVCGARVLVKPYREKSRLLERKYAYKSQHAMHYSPHFMDKDSELNSSDNLRFRKQLSEEHGQTLELESRRSSELRFTPKSFSHYPYIGHSMDELKCSEAHTEAESPPSAKRFNYLLDVLNNDKMRHINTSCRDQDSSQGPNLPESPFASAIGNNSISTIARDRQTGTGIIEVEE